MQPVSLIFVMILMSTCAGAGADAEQQLRVTAALGGQLREPPPVGQKSKASRQERIMVMPRTLSAKLANARLQVCSMSSCTRSGDACMVCLMAVCQAEHGSLFPLLSALQFLGNNLRSESAYR